MPPPSVFVSSTYVDLRYVREHISNFITSVGYVPRLFEKGGVGFDWRTPIDESCYEAVKESDIFVLIIGGRYGSPATSSIIGTAKKYDSVTRKEYKTAIGKNIPIFIFVDAQVLTEYSTYKQNRKNTSIKYVSVDSTLVFELLDDIYGQALNNYVQTFSTMADITDRLRERWAAMMQSLLHDRSWQYKLGLVRINALKLFYYRRQRKKSVNQLAKELGLKRQEYSRLESIKAFRKSSRASFDGYHERYFRECQIQTLERIEKALGCPGALRSGQHDDFLAHYVEHYNKWAGKKGSRRAQAFPFLPFSTKIVAFDFDGTITEHGARRTTWEMIWEHLGYSINECADYHTRFRNRQITHAEWCKLTLDKFRDRNLKRSDLTNLAKNLNVINGFGDLVEELERRQVKMHIVSGSIISIIRDVLGVHAAKFDSIKANELVFGSDGTLTDIVGTQYDFEGKADYVRRLVTDRKCSPMDVLFVGNAANDRWVANAGVRTLCVNPMQTDPDNPKHWTANIREMQDMREILKYI